VDKVVHFEIPFDNKDRAMKFYAKFRVAAGDARMNYVMAMTSPTGPDYADRSRAINGGLFARPKEAPGPDRGRRVRGRGHQKVSRGRQVVTPKHRFGHGRVGRITDTEGNVIGLFEAAMG
jgi:predicted enzyme related to lactoylglutathione lyase